ncbi:MAG: hypothetical protein QNL62_23740 [Gammaproteobacteria bacterium]|nr:hypothetical protein [Gammaproteobacteria bacterium]
MTKEALNRFKKLLGNNFLIFNPLYPNPISIDAARQIMENTLKQGQPETANIWKMLFIAAFR